MAAEAGAEGRPEPADGRTEGEDVGAEGGAGADRDDDPALGDWRLFRARLVEQQRTSALDIAEAAGDPGDAGEYADAAMVPPPRAAVAELEMRERRRREEATAANRDLVEQQTPELADEPVWAHAIPQPERGCLLLAAADAFEERQQYFAQAVILLLDHGPEGSVGVVLPPPPPRPALVL